MYFVSEYEKRFDAREGTLHMERQRKSELTEIVGMQFCRIKLCDLPPARYSDYIIIVDNSSNRLVYCRAVKRTITYSDGTKNIERRIEPIVSEALPFTNLDGLDIG